MPSVLPRSSLPRKRRFSQRPSFIARSAAGIGARQRQHQRAGVLGDADAVRAGRVDDEDAARAGGGDIDVVDAGAGAGDHFQMRRRREQSRIDLRRASNEERVGVRQIDSQLGGRSAGAGIDRPGIFGAKQFESGKQEGRQPPRFSSRVSIIPAFRTRRVRGVRRPAMVQTAKSFQMVRNNAVTRHDFHRLFHRNCVNRRTRSWGADLKGARVELCASMAAGHGGTVMAMASLSPWCPPR